MTRNILIGLIAILSVCILLACAIFLIPFTPYARDAYRLVGIGAPTREVFAPPTVSSGITSASQSQQLAATPLASVANDTANALANTNIPPRDLYQIVPRLKKNFALATAQPTPLARARRAGDKDQFFVVEDLTLGKYRSANATLQYVTPHVYAWVEDGMNFDQAALQKSADFFENNIYPTNHKYFGVEKTGVDGDGHINILSTKFNDAAGYFSREDFFPRTMAPFSNQRNIVYINIESVKPGTESFSAVLAHEFQHLIHAYEAPHSTSWIDEGMGDLAIKVNGFPVGGVLNEFAKNPGTQLNTWTNGPRDSAAHYAASYLFFNYAATRFGPDFTREVILAPREGTFGVQAALAKRMPGLSVEDFFAEWAVTNYLNDPKVENGKYAYNNEAFKITNEVKLNQYPKNARMQMNEFSSQYFSLTPSSGDVTIYFTGTTTAKLLPTIAHSGKWMWWSNRGDVANMSLTRSIDLSRAQGKATLNFWTWYDIEKNYDYAYVQVSTDGGKSWDILPGKSTTTENPNGASYGHALTGKSGTKDEKSPAQWIQEQMDLSAYAGKQILLRFEYITDDAYNAPSWVVDDIAIPEISFSDDGESGVNGWDAKGFIRTDNVLPQKYIVQVVECCNPTRIVRIPLNDLNRGSYALTNFGKGIERATIIVNAFAPVTTEPTEFEYAVVPK